MPRRAMTFHGLESLDRRVLPSEIGPGVVNTTGEPASPTITVPFEPQPTPPLPPGDYIPPVVPIV